MKTNARRRSRLRSSQYASERWRPSPLLVVLLVGILCGLFLGIRGGFSDNGESLQEHYLLLVSDLYAQGATLTSVRDRLISIGYTNPAASVLAVADRTGVSKDSVKKQEADQLRQFSDALAVGATGTNVGAAVTPQATTEAASSTDSAPATEVPSSPTTAPLALVTATPVPANTPAPAATPTPDNAPAPAANTAPVNPPLVATATPVTRVASTSKGKKGTVVSTDKKPVVVRKTPSTKSPAVAVAPYGATVQVLSIVKGEAVLPGGVNWFHVIYSGHEGYIYGTLVKVEG